MYKIIHRIIALSILCIMQFPINAQYTMPIETAEHEGTWLQWPHNNLYGPYYRDELKVTFVGMTKELIKGENVHIIAYDADEYNYILQTLAEENVALDNIDFYIFPNDDCWIRDNGPIFVYDDNEELVLLDWGFNGWGNEAPYDLCNVIPQSIATDINKESIDLNAMVLEGGAIEIDGNGTFLATKSSILGDDRNPNLTQTQVEEYLSNHLGVSNFIWLDGVPGLDITDMHIDGFAKFHDANTIVCMDSLDLIYWEVPATDISTLYNAKNIDNEPYNYVYLPLTESNVTTTWNNNLGYKGSYVNYYVGNAVVLVPTYDDPKDEEAIAILQGIYPNREVVGVDVRDLYYSGGMVHCVTQQQPKSQNSVSIYEPVNLNIEILQNSPNPFKDQTQIKFLLKESADVQLRIFDSKGVKISTLVNANLNEGEHIFNFYSKDIASGIYTYIITVNGLNTPSQKMILSR
jgi:agmatine deiminase